MHPLSASPDATLFAALLASPASPPRGEMNDLADLVLRLAGAVRETNLALREASACLAAEGGGHRLPKLLARAEAAALEQAKCTSALIERLAPEQVAA